MSVLYPESLVWIPEFEVIGRIVGPMGAFYSTVAFTAGGVEREVLMENNEFEFLEEAVIEYDAD